MSIRNLTIALILAAIMPLQALAAANIKLTVTADKVVAAKESPAGEKRMPAKTVMPGEIVIYTIHYENRGDQPATNVVVKNPVPKNTVYVAGSASGKGADITFSADGGKSFEKASSVTYQVRDSSGKPETRRAGPENYTHVRWVIARVDAGQSGELEYRVRVK